MHRHSRNEAPGRTLPLLVGFAAVECAAGCENVPPYLERSYLRAGETGLLEPLSVKGDRGVGPFLGLAGTLGTLLEVERTQASAVEFEAKYLYNLGPGAEFDGIGFGADAAWRRFWGMERRVRPNVGFGAGYLRMSIDGRLGRYDPLGPELFADGGVDYMITSRFGIGARVRGLVRYELADDNHGLVPGAEFTLHSVWRF